MQLCCFVSVRQAELPYLQWSCLASVKNLVCVEINRGPPHGTHSLRPLLHPLLCPQNTCAEHSFSKPAAYVLRKNKRRTKTSTNQQLSQFGPLSALLKHKQGRTKRTHRYTRTTGAN